MANINGNNQDNVLTGTIGGDLIRGRGGNDEINGLDGDDRLKGGSGQDAITDGAGYDQMWGGSGADTFILVDGDGERDRIRDWEDQDTIDLSDWGVQDISELTFQQLNNGDVLIKFGDEELEVEGRFKTDLTAADFDASDFIFAPTPTYRTIDFDGLDQNVIPYGAPVEYIDPGHQGLTWSDQFYFAEHDEMQTDGYMSGIDNRTSSGDNVGINGYGANISVSSATDFDFEQMTVGSLYLEGMSLTVTGYDDGQVTGSQTFTLSTQSSQVVDLDDAIFNQVDEVQFISDGGTLHPDYQNIILGGNITHFYIDDMVVG